MKIRICTPCIFDLASLLCHRFHQDADMPVDIALVQLDEPVTDVDPARVYSGSDEEGMIVTVVGRGERGNGPKRTFTEIVDGTFERPSTGKF